MRKLLFLTLLTAFYSLNQAEVLSFLKSSNEQLVTAIKKADLQKVQAALKSGAKPEKVVVDPNTHATALEFALQKAIVGDGHSFIFGINDDYAEIVRELAKHMQPNDIRDAINFVLTSYPRENREIAQNVYFGKGTYDTVNAFVNSLMDLASGGKENVAASSNG